MIQKFDNPKQSKAKNLGSILLSTATFALLTAELVHVPDTGAINATTKSVGIASMLFMGISGYVVNKNKDYEFTNLKWYQTVLLIVWFLLALAAVCVTLIVVLVIIIMNL